MKKMHLADFIAPLIGKVSRTAAVKTPDGQCDYGSLLFPVRADLHGANVALYTNDLLKLLPALCSLDGIASAICIIPPDADTKGLKHLLSLYEFDVLLTDKVDELEALSDLTIEGFESGVSAGGSLGDIDRQETLWLVPTSGTTGQPKLVSHTTASLTAALSDDLAHVNWGLFYDFSRFAGLQVVLQSLISDGTLVAPSRQASLSEQIAFCVANGVSHISATPTLWRKILLTPAADDLTMVQITLGGEAADQSVLNALAAKFPDARITHIYASTEAGVGFSVSDGKAGFPLKFLHNPRAGLALKVQNDKLFMSSQLSLGQYTSGEAYTIEIEGREWIATGDLVRIEKDRFHFLGRENGLLNIGGDKVLPDEIKEVLLQNPLIHEALIYAKSNPFTGEIVAADIVLSEQAEASKATKDSIILHAKEHLAAHKVPRIIKFVTEIESNSSGKAAVKIS